MQNIYVVGRAKNIICDLRFVRMHAHAQTNEIRGCALELTDALIRIYIITHSCPPTNPPIHNTCFSDAQHTTDESTRTLTFLQSCAVNGAEQCVGSRAALERWKRQGKGGTKKNEVNVYYWYIFMARSSVTDSHPHRTVCIV